MPTNRRKRLPHRRTDLGELDPFQRIHLEDGHYYGPGTGYDSREDFEGAWEIHGEALLAAYVEAHPCRRPLGWWICEHQERPAIRAGAKAADLDYERRDGYFGFLHAWDSPYEADPIQEPQHEYLARAGLLTRAELELLPAVRASWAEAQRGYRECVDRLRAEDARRGRPWNV